jgi:hypothetical protein
MNSIIVREIAQSPLPTVNATMPTRYVRRRPQRSDPGPQIGIDTAAGEHVSRKCPRVEVRTAKLRHRHRYDRADDRVVEAGKNDSEQDTEQHEHAALAGGILF